MGARTSRVRGTTPPPRGGRGGGSPPASPPHVDPANPAMSFHKLGKAKDKRFWSVRVSSDLRLIVHRTADSLLLCYVDHHDKAYAWAERRKLETHPTTGA